MKDYNEILAYRPAELRVGKSCVYVEFYAYDPALQALRRKRIKLNYIKSVRERKEYGRALCIRINEQLKSGWNPWIEQESARSYFKFTDAVEEWMNRQNRLYQDGVIRKDTLDEYKSKTANLLRYNDQLKQPIVYTYQLTSRYMAAFLDEMYVGRNNTAITYNNYLNVMGNLCKHLLSREYIKADPCDKIQPIAKNRTGKKRRTNITAAHLQMVSEYLREQNKPFLLACYLEYYCFVRPKELSFLHVRNIDFAAGMLTIPDTASKNRKVNYKTIPLIVLELMRELKIDRANQSDYLFSVDFLPGPQKRSEKVYRDCWIRVRRELKLPESYHFYSFKDTGVSKMLDSNIASIAVRDQASHSSISITEIYAENRVVKANEEIRRFEGDF